MKQGEITAKVLNDTVELALHCRRPDNGMKVNPRSKAVKEAKTRLEWILDCANRGRVEIAKELPFVGETGKGSRKNARELNREEA